MTPSVVETREVCDVQASANVEVWLTQIGFSFGFEFYKEGFRYTAIIETPGMRNTSIHIYVYKLKKVSERANFLTSSDVAPGYLVEFQCEEEPQQKEYGVRLLNFARGFSSFVTLSEHANAR